MNNNKPHHRREHWLAAGVLLISTLCCFHELAALPDGLLVGPQNEGRNDLTAYMLPARAFARQTLLEHGQIPLWQPYELTGIPWLGNPQSAMFYPPNWLYLLSEGVALAGWLMAGHLWFGGLGVYLYCRKLHLTWGSALVAGCGYLGAPFLIAYVGEGHLNQVCVAAWLPWGLIHFERLRRGEKGGGIGLATILTLAFFAGHAQELLYFLVILSAWLVASCLAHLRNDAPSARRLLGNWCLVGIAVIGLTAVELIPIYAYTKQAVRSTGLTVEAAARFSLNSSSLWQLLDPLILGGPETTTLSGRFYWETVCHFGLALTLLAGVGIFTSWHRPESRKITITLMFCILFGLGTHTPFFALMFHGVPGISFFRGSSRILMHLSLFVSILAGYGVAALTEEKQSPRFKQIAIWLAGTAAGLMLLVGSLNPLGWEFHPPDVSTARDFDPWTIGIGAGGFLMMAILSRIIPGRSWKIVMPIALVVVTAELSWHAHRVLRVVRSDNFRSDSDIVSFLKENAGLSRVLAEQELLSDWEAWRHGVAKVHGYEPVPPARAVVLIDAMSRQRTVQEEFIGQQSTFPQLYRQNVVNHLGVKYAVVPAGNAKPKPPWRMVQRGQVPESLELSRPPRTHSYEIWENTDVLPRAFVLGKTIAAEGNSDPVEALARLDATESVLVPQDVLPPGERQSFRPARILSATPNEIVVEAEFDEPGYLVLTDLYSAGWRVTVDGDQQPLLPVNVVFRGVALPAGAHTVRFSFSPPGLILGGIISGFSLMLLLLVAASQFRKGEASELPNADAPAKESPSPQ